MKILKNNKNIIGLCLTIFILIFLFQLYKKKSLKNSIETYAVYIGNTGGVGDATKHFKFKTKENKEIESNCSSNLKLEIGDTVKIKYSIQHPMYIEVIDQNFNKLVKK